MSLTYECNNIDIVIIISDGAPRGGGVLWCCSERRGGVVGCRGEREAAPPNIYSSIGAAAATGEIASNSWTQ